MKRGREGIEMADDKASWMGKTKNKPKLTLIRVLAFEQDMSIVELAKKSGVSHETIYNYINGETRPYAIKLYKIAKALDTTVEEILENSQ